MQDHHNTAKLSAGSRRDFLAQAAGVCFVVPLLPDEAMAVYGLATADRHLGDSAKAEAEFGKARSLLRMNVALARGKGENNRGLGLWYSGNLAGAAAAFRSALTDDPTYAEAHNNLGGVLWQQKQGLGAPVKNWDFALYKGGTITKRVKYQFRVEAFNFLNHASFNSIDASFGSINGAGDPRVIQLGLKLQF